MVAAWEYRVLTARMGHPLRDEDGNEYGKFGQETLNALGKERWQICGYDCSEMRESAELNVHTLIIGRPATR
jgi:hypothetical protein